jgi:hypothetical protein
MKKPFYTLHSLCAVGLLGSVAFLAAYGCSSEGSQFNKTGSGGTGSGDTTTTGGSTTDTTGGSTTDTTGGSTTTVSGTTSGGGGDPTGGSGGGTTSGGGTEMTTSGGGAGGSGPGAGGSGPGGSGGSGVGGSGGSGMPPCPKPAPGTCHEFIANDNANNRVNYVNEFTSTKPGGVVWTAGVGDTGANSPRTIEIVDNAMAKGGKAVLVSINRGYVEIDLTDGTVLGRVNNQSNVTGACRLPDGNTALGAYPNIKIVSKTGSAVTQFALPTGDNLRAINRNPADGSYWLSLTESIFQVSSTGQQLWKGNMGAGTKGYAVWWRTGGGAYATSGEPATVIEMNGMGGVVSTIGGRTKFPDLDFFSGFQRLANGNYIVANWLGHVSAPASNRPHVVELTPQNTMPWTWGNQSLARQITNVYVFR